MACSSMAVFPDFLEPQTTTLEERLNTLVALPDAANDGFIGTEKTTILIENHNQSKTRPVAKQLSVDWPWYQVG